VNCLLAHEKEKFVRINKEKDLARRVIPKEKDVNTLTQKEKIKHLVVIEKKPVGILTPKDMIT
jgi:hypothetical protein